MRENPQPFYTFLILHPCSPDPIAADVAVGTAYMAKFPDEPNNGASNLFKRRHFVYPQHLLSYLC